MTKTKKPKFHIGQVVKMAISREMVGMVQGDLVTIASISKQGRYEVLHLSGWVGWMDEDWLCDAQESFFDAVRNDLDMTAEQKAYWLDKEQKDN